MEVNVGRMSHVCCRRDFGCIGTDRVHSITSVTIKKIIVHVSQKASLRASSALSAVNAQDTSVADLCKTLLNITVMDTAD